jgi:hypothetical protein
MAMEPLLNHRHFALAFFILIIAGTLALIQQAVSQSPPHTTNPDSVRASNAIAAGRGSLVGVTTQGYPVATALPVIIPTSTSRTGLIELSLDPRLYPGQEAAIGSQISQALTYVSGRFYGRQPIGPISVIMTQSSDCTLSGISHTTVRAVQVFTCNNIEPSRAVAILAHELVHQLANDHYPPIVQGSDLILVEGLATWGAGDYWLDGRACFADMARQQSAAAGDSPLTTSYVGQSADVMNSLYYQWASFVEFLLDRYGLEAFDRAYASGDGTPSSADYRAAFQRDLPTLQAEWRDWLAQASCPAKAR